MSGHKKGSVLEAALAKLERRKGQHWQDREPYTAAEVRALMAYAGRTIRERQGTRAERSRANKAAWREGDRSRWT